MALYEFDNLLKKYDGFHMPIYVVVINETDFNMNKAGAHIDHVEVDLTCGYEASIAVFRICNCFNEASSCFLFEELKKFIQLGSGVTICLGYGKTVREVFLGVITRINFIKEELKDPYIQVTAMDVKGIMMANSYARQLKAASYGEAVKEILSQTAYEKLSSESIIRKLEISDTPDKKKGKNDDKANANTIEMVSESDYEFVVKAAKRFYYEFFTECGTVYFRKAKTDTEILMELSFDKGIRELDISYDITGLAEQVEVRAMDPGKGVSVSIQKKLNNKISTGNKAKGIVRGSKKVMIDPTLLSKEDAQMRANHLAEEMAYRFAGLHCRVTGLPELVPGSFIKITGIQAPKDNQFYITGVRHQMSLALGYTTDITGKGISVEG